MTAQLPSRELLQKIIETSNEIITVNNGTNEDISKNDTNKIIGLYDRLNDDLASPSVVKALAEFALAAHEQEPVGYYRLANDGVSYYLSHPTEKFDDDVIQLYTHPAPSIPAAVPEMAAVGEMPFLGTQEKAFVSGWNACRAAMLNGGKS